MTVAKLVKLAEVAAVDTAMYIAQDLKGLATKHGWDSKSIDGLSVSYSNSSFSIDVDPTVENDVSRLEYGTERVAPTAVLRKYGSNTQEAEKFFIKNLEKKVGVKL